MITKTTAEIMEFGLEFAHKLKEIDERFGTGFLFPGSELRFDGMSLSLCDIADCKTVDEFEDILEYADAELDELLGNKYFDGAILCEGPLYETLDLYLGYGDTSVYGKEKTETLYKELNEIIEKYGFKMNLSRGGTIMLQCEESADKEHLGDVMYSEAWDRMHLLGINEEDIDSFSLYRKIPKVYVDHENHQVKHSELTADEKEMVHFFESDCEYMVYYIIQDEGIWPDGCKFSRYTFLYVDKYEEEYGMIKEDCIRNCKTVPAYVINMEDSGCNEHTEIGFQNVDGMIINVT